MAYPEAFKEWVRSEYRNGKGTVELAREYRLSTQTVHAWCRDLPGSLNRQEAQRKRRNQERLVWWSEGVVQQILDLYARGHGYQRIAREIGWGNGGWKRVQAIVREFSEPRAQPSQLTLAVQSRPSRLQNRNRHESNNRKI